MIRSRVADKWREKYIYKGNGDRKDSFDQFVVTYFKDKMLYAIGETINVAP